MALGDALVRANRYLGYDVVAANYIGMKAHIAKSLVLRFNGAKPETLAGGLLLLPPNGEGAG